MPKLILSVDGVVMQQVQLTKSLTAIGRRPQNDIVLDNLSVSGEHALVHFIAGEVSVEDLKSTNGTYINGKPVQKQVVQSGEVMEMGKYKLKLVSEKVPPKPASPACIRVLSGSAEGRELMLDKEVITLGQRDVAVAAITRQSPDYLLSYVSGHSRPQVNGLFIGDQPVPLRHDDVIELAGTQMRFVIL